MKNQSWVKEITTIFENFNRKTSFRRSKSSVNSGKKMNNKLSNSRILSAIEFEDTCEQNEVIRNEMTESQFLKAPPTPPISPIVVEDHCVTVEYGRKMFDHKGSIRKIQANLKKISSFDIFSGKADDPDIPPIEAELDDQSVQINNHSNFYNHIRSSFKRKNKVHQNNGTGSLSNNNVLSAQQKRLLMKKSGIGSGNFQSIATDKDIEKENEGVILRMRDQEQYYEGRVRYQSMLPEVSQGHSSPGVSNVSEPFRVIKTSVPDVDNNTSPIIIEQDGNHSMLPVGPPVKMRQSLLKEQQTVEDEPREHPPKLDRKAFQNSVVMGDIVLPPANKELDSSQNSMNLSFRNRLTSSVKVLPKMPESKNDDKENNKAGYEDEDDDMELEPSYPGMSESMMITGVSKDATNHKYNDENGNSEYPPTANMSFQKLMSLNAGPQRIRWAETDEGKKLIKLKNLDSDIIRWQETQFEVITSEASYYRSLQLLVDRIYKSPLMSCTNSAARNSTLPYPFSPSANPVTEANTNGDNPPSPNATDDSFTFVSNAPVMTPLQKHHLFSNILEIHIVTGELLKCLESRWRENPFIEDLSDIIIEFSSKKLTPYVTYLRNQQYQTDTFNQLLTKPEFQQVVKELEMDPELGMMSLSSFLLLPMQRPFRLKLLMEVVCNKTPKNHPSIPGVRKAIETVEHLIKECTEGKILMEQKEQLMRICNRLKFPERLTRVHVGSSPLLHEGRIRAAGTVGKVHKQLSVGGTADHKTDPNNNGNNNNAQLKVGGGNSGKMVQLYVFEDHLIISKEKNHSSKRSMFIKRPPICLSSSTDDENSGNKRSEIVIEHCPRKDVIYMEGGRVPLNSTTSNNSTKNSKTDGSRKWRFGLKLNKGARGTEVEYRCEVDSLEEMEKWKEVFSASEHYFDDIGVMEALVLLDRDGDSTIDEEECLNSEIESQIPQLPLTAGQIVRIIKTLPNNKAIASSQGQQGMIPMSHVRLVGGNDLQGNAGATLTREVASAAATLAASRVCDKPKCHATTASASMDNAHQSRRPLLVRQNQLSP